MKERTTTIARQEEHAGRTIIIAHHQWDDEVKKIAPSIANDYCCGYISVGEGASDRCDDYNEFIQTDKITFVGPLTFLNIKKKHAGKQYIGFDTAHYWNMQNPNSQTVKSTLKRAKKIAEELNEHNIP